MSNFPHLLEIQRILSTEEYEQIRSIREDFKNNTQG